MARYEWSDRFMQQSLYEEMLFHAHNNWKSIKIPSHRTLAAQVDDFYIHFHAGGAKLAHELFEFLMSWLNNHIVGCDLAYVEFASKR